MNRPQGKLVVFYDGSCPKCIKDRERYEKMAGETGKSVEWLDITGQEARLREEGIDPEKALRELHVKDSKGRIHSEMDAYILLMSRVPVLKPLAWLIGLPVIRPLLARIYHYLVDRRLAKSDQSCK